MIFNSPIVQKYILSGAKLVSKIRRKGYYRVSRKVIEKVRDKRFSDKVVTITPLTPSSLSRLVTYSGFKSVEEWIMEAKKLHKAKIDPNKFEIIVVEISS
jgi:hypothetical protein